MGNQTIMLKDSAGVTHEFHLYELYGQLKAGNHTIFGMTLEAMLYMRKWYQIYNGPDPMTKQTVDATFKDLTKVPEHERFEHRMQERQRTKRLFPCPFHRPLTNPSAVNT